MRIFAIGYALILLLVHVVNACMARRAWTINDHIETGAVLVIIPFAMALAIAAFIHVLSPRKIFCSASQSSLNRIMTGVLCAVLTLSLMALFVVVANASIHEWVIAIIAASAATLVVVRGMCRRLQPGRCLICDYDITASLVQGRCPECGTSIKTIV